MTHLGDALLTSPDQENEAGRQCRAHYERIRDSVFREYPWNSVTVYTGLASSGAPPWGLAYRFALPPDPYCLRVLELEDETVTWKVNGRFLDADAAGPLNIAYTARILDTSVYDPMLVQAITLLLAWQIGPKLDPTRIKRATLWQEYRDFLAEAETVDSQEGTPDDSQASEFLHSRR